MTLRMRLSLAFLLVVIVPLAVAAGVVGRGVPKALDDEARDRVQAARAGVVALLEQSCTGVRLGAEVLARESAVAGDPGRAAHAAVQDVVGRGLAGYAVVADGSGHVLARAGSLPPGLRPRIEELTSCSRDADVTGPPAIADSLTTRVPGGPDRQVAVAVPLDDAVTRRLAAATDAGVTLLAGDRVLASTESADRARELAQDAIGLSRPRHVAGRVALAVPARVGPATVVVSVRRAGIGNLEGLLAGVLAAALVLSAVIGWLLARVTTRPLAELGEAAARVAGGDLETRIDVRSHDEVGQLAEAFNEMTDELRAYVGELQSSRDELRHNLARLGDTLSSTHDLGRILGVIVETAMGSARASAGAAYVVQAGREELLLRAGRGLDGRGAAARLAIGEGVTGRVAETGEAILGSVAADYGLQPAPGEPTAREVISVPMRTGGGVLGVLNLYDRADGRAFDTSDLATIRTFAGQAAVALDNVLLHQEAQRLSLTDALTGLGNYRFFQTTVSREVERAARFHRALALLMLDLDRFKQVNDIYGHQVGNAVLVELARRLRDEVREVDVVSRYGGEEFVAVLPETEPEGAGHIAERICAAVREQPFAAGGHELAVTVSIGVAVFPVHGDGPAALVRAADEALYAAKTAGRDQWRISTGQATNDVRR